MTKRLIRKLRSRNDIMMITIGLCSVIGGIVIYKSFASAIPANVQNAYNTATKLSLTTLERCQNKDTIVFVVRSSISQQYFSNDGVLISRPATTGNCTKIK